MTDNEIIKALEACKEADECVICPLRHEKTCFERLSTATLDLINRQKAEISKLQSDQYAIDKFARDLCKERMLKGKAIADFEDLQDYIKKEKNEAIREFAEKLKTKISTTTVYGAGVYYKKEYILPEAVDNLVKEMTEGGNV